MFEQTQPRPKAPFVVIPQLTVKTRCITLGSLVLLRANYQVWGKKKHVHAVGFFYTRAPDMPVRASVCKFLRKVIRLR